MSLCINCWRTGSSTMSFKFRDLPFIIWIQTFVSNKYFIKILGFQNLLENLSLENQELSQKKK